MATHEYRKSSEAMQWFRCLVTSFSMWRPRFNHRPIHVDFVVDKVVLGKVFLSVLWFSHQ